MNDDFTSSNEWDGNWTPTGEVVERVVNANTSGPATSRPLATSTWGELGCASGREPGRLPPQPERRQPRHYSLRSPERGHVRRSHQHPLRRERRRCHPFGDDIDGGTPVIGPNAVIEYSGNVVDDGPIACDGEPCPGAYKLSATIDWTTRRRPERSRSTRSNLASPRKWVGLASAGPTFCLSATRLRWSCMAANSAGGRNVVGP